MIRTPLGFDRNSPSGVSILKRQLCVKGIFSPRDFALHAVAGVFKPGQEIKGVFSPDLVIHAEIFSHHRFLFYDEKVESGEFFLHKMERVFDGWTIMSGC